MDINNLFATWNRIFRNRLNYTRLPSQGAEAEIPESTCGGHNQPEAGVNTENSPDSGFEKGSKTPENAENGPDHEVGDAPEINYSPKADNAPEAHDTSGAGEASEAHEVPDNSEPENNASCDVRDTNTENSVGSGLRNFSRFASDWVTAKVKMAATKAKAAALQVRDSMISAVNTLKDKGVIGAAKALKDWVREHPWETALIVAPLVAAACAAIALLAIGFGPGGIAAGSAAATIHAGIGNVVAHSLFATCTSAMMGGYGAPIIFGGTWALALVATAAAKKLWGRWNSRNERGLVRMKTGPSMFSSESLSKAMDTAIFSSAAVAAFLVYYVKSWMQARKQRPEDQRPLL